MEKKIFVINPGSTSTKVALFLDDKNVWEKKIFHEAEDLAAFESVNDQLEYRYGLILRTLEEEGIDLSGTDAIACRGGSCLTVESGVYRVSRKMIEDTRNAAGGPEHASMLGVQLGELFQRSIGGELFTQDPIVVDEYSDLARMTGIKGMYRSVSSHALNQKAVAKRYAAAEGKRYDEIDLIVAHIDGGITVAAHHRGRMVDCNSGAGGDGPYTPSRIGSIGVSDLISAFGSEDLETLGHMCNTGGGLTSLVGTNDADLVLEKIENGDENAERAWEGMIYQICKQIGAMAAVLEGKAEAILL
ncbi:MAG: butyrate kinase, partial [Oscillospiraceae bacterium]|nr:butyrate kinase [Oscillospiraceae bacterium]